jgi:Lrp/AsnC family leucine-responsive transcriptional regulator
MPRDSKKMIEIDDVDKIIIRHLSNNARAKIKDIAKDCEISSPTVKKRIEKLKKDLIVKEQIIINWNFFNYRYPASIAVNLNPDKEDEVCELVQKKLKTIGIDYFIGSYDLCFFVFAESIQKLKEVEQLLTKEKGVNQVDVLIWSKVYPKFTNLKI